MFKLPFNRKWTFDTNQEISEDYPFLVQPVSTGENLYVLNNDGTIDITYDAIKDGKERQIKQKGTVIDKSSNAEWTIQ